MFFSCFPFQRVFWKEKEPTLTLNQSTQEEVQELSCLLVNSLTFFNCTQILDCFELWCSKFWKKNNHLNISNFRTRHDFCSSKIGSIPSVLDIAHVKEHEISIHAWTIFVSDPFLSMTRFFQVIWGRFHYSTMVWGRHFDSTMKTWRLVEMGNIVNLTAQ